MNTYFMKYTTFKLFYIVYGFFFNLYIFLSMIDFSYVTIPLIPIKYINYLSLLLVLLLMVKVPLLYHTKYMDDEYISIKLSELKIVYADLDYTRQTNHIILVLDTIMLFLMILFASQFLVYIALYSAVLFITYMHEDVYWTRLLEYLAPDGETENEQIPGNIK